MLIFDELFVLFCTFCIVFSFDKRDVIYYFTSLVALAVWQICSSTQVSEQLSWEWSMFITICSFICLTISFFEYYGIPALWSTIVFVRTNANRPRGVKLQLKKEVPDPVKWTIGMQRDFSGPRYRPTPFDQYAAETKRKQEKEKIETLTKAVDVKHAEASPKPMSSTLTISACDTYPAMTSVTFVRVAGIIVNVVTSGPQKVSAHNVSSGENSSLVSVASDPTLMSASSYSSSSKETILKTRPSLSGCTTNVMPSASELCASYLPVTVASSTSGYSTSSAGLSSLTSSSDSSPSPSSYDSFKTVLPDVPLRCLTRPELASSRMEFNSDLSDTESTQSLSSGSFKKGLAVVASTERLKNKGAFKEQTSYFLDIRTLTLGVGCVALFGFICYKCVKS